MKLFDSVPGNRPKKNKFDLSYEHKTTFNMGTLIPMMVEEVVPGDKFRVSSEVFLRFMALIAPVMHRVDVTTHYFFVPYRLIWAAWQDYITGGRDGLSAPVPPNFKPSDLYAISPGYLRPGGLLDHLGFPVMGEAGVFNAAYNANNFCAFAPRAYTLIYDQYYRDQNTEASVLPAGFLSDGTQLGSELTAIMTLRNRAWEKDYYTSALPWTQRGAEVSIPINSTITVPTSGFGAAPFFRRTDTGASVAGGVLSQAPAGAGGPHRIESAAVAGTSTYYDPQGSLIASSTSLTINALRVSVRLQEWLERNARGGGRYIEQLLMHFGVVSSDARLQRAEYLGGGRQPVVISEVLQTAPAAGASTPLADMGGHGISVGRSNGFTKFFEEHGLVIGIISVLPKTAYQQAMPSFFWRGGVNTQHYFPEFAHLGEQAIKNFEVYTNFTDAGAAPNFNGTFAYQSRYSEYKYRNNISTGRFRTSLLYWNLDRVFTSQAQLNSAFIIASPRSDIFAVTSNIDKLVCQIYHKIDALRPMPYFGTPSL